MLTADDLDALSERFATKEYLAEQLGRFATKQDLERFATKEELGNLGSRMEILFEDLKSTMKALFDGLSARLDVLEERTFGTPERRRRSNKR